MRERLIEDEAIRLARLVHAQQERIIEGAEQVLDLFVSTATVQDRTLSLCEPLVARMLASSPRYDNLGYADSNGRLLCGGAPLEAGRDISARPYFQLAMQSDRAVTGPYGVSRRSGRPVLHVARRFAGPDGRIAGVAFVAIRLDWLNEQLHGISLPAGALATVADRDGTILAQLASGPPFVGQPVNDQGGFMFRGTEAGVAPRTGSDGRQRIAAWLPPSAGSAGLMVAVGLDRATAFASVTDGHWAGVSTIIAGAALALLMALAIGGLLIRRPVMHLVGRASRWRDGDRAARAAPGGAEFALIANALDDMTGALDARDRALRDALESTTECVIVLDRDWRFTYLNERGKAHFAHGRDLLGQVLWDAFPAEALAPFAGTYREAVATGRPGRVDAYFAPTDSYWTVHAYPSDNGLAVYARDVTDQHRVAAALAESESLMRAAFEQAAVGMAISDCDEVPLQVNDKLCEITGYGRDELLATGCQDITHPDDRDADRLAHRQLLAGDRPGIAMTKRFIRKDGAVVWVNLIGTVIRDAGGRPHRLFSVIEDVTERKRIELALRESEERLRLALEATRQGVTDIDLIARAERCSQAAASIMGLAEEVTAFADWKANVHPDDRGQVEANWDRAEASPGTDVSHEYRFRQPDGSWRWIASYARLRFEAGRAVRAIGVVQDISERKQTEDALKASETRLRLAQEAGRIGMWDWDLVTGELHWSDTQCRQYGIDPARGNIIPHAAWSEAVHPDDLPAVRARVRQSLKTGQDTETEYRIVTLDGVRWINGRGHVFRDGNGRAVRMIGIDIDVTERRVLEDELRRLTETLEARVRTEVAAREDAQLRAAHAERMMALGKLASGIAHDFNNVMQTVSGAITLIFRRPDDQENILRVARRARQAIDRGESITNRLLAFGRRDRLQSVAIDPEAMLEDLREILTHTLEANVDITVEVEPGLRPLIADRSQLEAVMINLAANARDAMPDGGRLILSAADETGAAAGGAGYVRIAVTDTGSGMDAETLRLATEPFFSTKGAGRGTGLGLAMAKDFAEQSGGGLRVESAPGRGTTVTLWLPATGRDRLPALAEAGAASPEDDEPSLRVLLVDDQDEVREVLALNLEGCGQTVVAAASGAEALALLGAGERVDAVVTDLSMPGMDGLALIAAIRAEWPGLPAVLLTGFAEDDVLPRDAGRDEDNLAVLRKPATSRQIIDCLRPLIGRPRAAGHRMPDEGARPAGRLHAICPDG